MVSSRTTLMAAGRGIGRRIVAAVMAWVASAAVLAAQAPQVQEEFVPVKPGDLGEQLPATPLVFAAYAVVWVVLIAYVFMLWRRIAKVEQELSTVHARMGGRRP